MATEVTYTEARANFAKIWDDVIANRQTVIIHRRGAEDLALLPADELAGLLETAHLLRSPRNAERLLQALNRAHGDELEPSTLESFRQESGFDE